MLYKAVDFQTLLTSRDKYSWICMTISALLVLTLLPLSHANLGLYREILYGLPFFLLSLLGTLAFRGKPIDGYLQAAAFVGLTATQIHIGLGKPELHFGLFVLLAFLVPFKSPMLILFGATLVAVHHLAFYFLQISGFNCLAFPQGQASFGLVLLHASYVVVESAVLCGFANGLSRREQVNCEAESILELLNPDKQGVDLSQEVAVRFPENKTIEIVYATFRKKMLGVREEFQTLDSYSSDVRERSDRTASQLAVVGNMVDDNLERARQIETLFGTVMSNVNTGIRNIQGVSRSVQMILTESARSLTGIRSAFDEVRKVPARFSEVEGSFTKLSKVLEAMNDVSKQINLLSLNAAIEAARSGEQGRGFAIVADEIRQLANRSAHGTAQISDIFTAVLSDIETTRGCLNTADQLSAQAERELEHVNGSLTTLGQENKEALDFFVEQRPMFENAQHDVHRMIEELGHFMDALSAQMCDIQQMTQSVQKLCRSVDDVENEMKIFRLSE